MNIDTDLRLASTGAVRRVLAENPSEFDPRKFLTASIRAMGEIRRARYEAFGCAGMGSRIEAIPLDRMASRYASGKLRARLN